MPACKIGTAQGLNNRQIAPFNLKKRKDAKGHRTARSVWSAWSLLPLSNRPTPYDSASKLDALQTLRAVRLRLCVEFLSYRTISSTGSLHGPGFASVPLAHTRSHTFPLGRFLTVWLAFVTMSACRQLASIIGSPVQNWIR